MVSWLNKFVIFAIIITLANFASDGFVFQQLDKVDLEGPIDEYGGSVACAVGVYISYPLLFGLPIMPGSDDIVVAAILGLLTLGIFSALNRPLRKRWKIAIFLLWWLVYRAFAWYLVVSTPGCMDNTGIINDAMSPLTPVFFILAMVLIIKIYMMRKR